MATLGFLITFIFAKVEILSQPGRGVSSIISYLYNILPSLSIFAHFCSSTLVHFFVQHLCHLYNFVHSFIFAFLFTKCLFVCFRSISFVTLVHLFSCQSLHLWICALLHLCINAFHHLCPFSGCSPLCSPTLAASTSHRGRACCQPAQAAPAFPPLSSISIFRTLSSLFLSYFHHYFTFSLNQYLHHRNPAPAQNVPAQPFPHPSIPPSTVSIIVTSVTSRSTCIC